MSLTPPKRLFHVPSMSTVMYVDVADDVGEKGYAAISHVWGDQKMFTADELGINSGVDWKIPLSNPLKIFRLTEAMSDFGEDYCWFDVLCMPQDKQNEINEEIPFMGDYYGGATRTLVLSDESYIVSDDLAMWCEMMEDIKEVTLDDVSWLHSHENLFDISRDIWFTRVWTLQEAVLSKKITVVDVAGEYVNLSYILEGVIRLSRVGMTYPEMLFGESHLALAILAAAIESYKDGIYDLVHVMDKNVNRNCYKQQDKFFGVLGVLGYKDFVVDYTINMDDLNIAIAKHAYSKGDISWMAVGRNVGTGFIQPMYSNFVAVGTIWVDNNSNIKFGDNALWVDAMTLGTVVQCEKFIPMDDNGSGFHGWSVRMFRGWGFDDDEIVDVFLDGVDTNPAIVETMKVFLDVASKGLDDDDQAIEIAKRLGGKDVLQNIRSVLDMNVARVASHNATVAKIRLDKDGDIPLIISGDADVGNKVKTVRLYDMSSNCLGIVCDSNKRKGVFVCMGMDVPRELYKPHNFLLQFC